MRGSFDQEVRGKLQAVAVVAAIWLGLMDIECRFLVE